MTFTTAFMVMSASASVASTGLIAEMRVQPGQHDTIIARTVGGMISYTDWPEPRPVLQLCISGTTSYPGAFRRIAQSAGRQVNAQTIAPGGATLGCDIFYLGAMDTVSRQRMMRAIRDRPVLSIAESDPDCRGGTIFCLHVLPDRVSFRLSIDAVSRSGVRIDPRVLRVALPEGGVK